MTIEITGAGMVTSRLRNMFKQVPYATQRTLNDIAFLIRGELNKDIGDALRTKKATENAFLVKKATKANLESLVYMKHDWHYIALQHHYSGGNALQIEFEKKMISMGYMSSNSSAIPIKKISKAIYNKMSSGIATSRGSGRSKYFVVKENDRSSHTKHLPPGVYLRLKTKVRPVVLFTREATYRKRLEILKPAKYIVRKEFEKLFFQNLKKAMT